MSCTCGLSDNPKVDRSEALHEDQNVQIIDDIKIGDYKKNIISRFGNPDEIITIDDGQVLYVMTYYIKNDAFYKIYFNYEDSVIGTYSELKPISE
jgi:hypothetical protein